MPLRANSKSIINKNTRNIAGKPLFAWSLEQAIESECFDDIYVATDSVEIRDIVYDAFPEHVTVLDRSAATCADTASTESAMLEFQQHIAFDIICLIQATSPLVQAADFHAAKRQFIDKKLDSLLTAVRSKCFFWTDDATPINYDPSKRPRRQDFDGCLMENGAFYFTRSQTLKKHGNRLGGKIGIHKMADETAVEIDDHVDWFIVEQFLSKRKTSATGLATQQIKALILDVDGTLTDGGMYYGPAGEALKKFHTRDAHGLQRLRESGVKICVISAEDSPAVAARMEKLEIAAYYPGVKNKFKVLTDQAKQWNISLQDIAYIGDDVNDLECINHVGTACCPADAVTEIQRQSHYVCKHHGGNGAVRETCEIILKINNLL